MEHLQVGDRIEWRGVITIAGQYRGTLDGRMGIIVTDDGYQHIAPIFELHRLENKNGNDF